MSTNIGDSRHPISRTYIEAGVSSLTSLLMGDGGLFVHFKFHDKHGEDLPLRDIWLKQHNRFLVALRVALSALDKCMLQDVEI